MVFFTQELHKLETDLGHFQQKWKTVWDRLELPTGQRETIHRNFSFNTQIVKSHGRSIHKRSTLEILVKGKMLGEAAKMFSQPHRFEKYTYTTPAYCDYCGQVLWGLLKTGKESLFSRTQEPGGLAKLWNYLNLCMGLATVWNFILFHVFVFIIF